ncbi:hypothetical protein DM02DRAFT_667401 [Periconia macrospinosa]|uniref:Uncharacterized protein n=1 Tax=Periconia macrospinosa TaxID=97972 RepID=A0A2V1E8M6_9PLEO|nr:hypothetical protein DM02DRAFT_667401 [Periconia macrospinosa]
MPSQVIQHPGLKCHIQLLQGVLSSTHLRKDKPPYSFQISESDLEDDEPTSERSSRNKENTATVSAVGLRVTIPKNDGVLKIKFRGKQGAEWSWKVEGLNVKVVRGGMGVQTTDVDIVDRRVGKTKDSETQTQLSIPLTISESELSRLILQKAILQEQEKGISGQSVRFREDHLSYEPVAIEANKKRKLSLTGTPRIPETSSLHVRAPEPPVFPQHLYLKCLRWPNPRHGNNPQGVLHIDTTEAQAWYEIHYLTQNEPRVLRQTPIDLHASTTIIEYRSLEAIVNYKNYEYDACIVVQRNLTVKNPFMMHVSSKERVWGNEASGQRVEFATHHIMFNALMDCAHRLSGRPAHLDGLTRSRVASQFCVNEL